MVYVVDILPKSLSLYKNSASVQVMEFEFVIYKPIPFFVIRNM